MLFTGTWGPAVLTLQGRQRCQCSWRNWTAVRHNKRLRFWKFLGNEMERCGIAHSGNCSCSTGRPPSTGWVNTSKGEVRDRHNVSQEILEIWIHLVNLHMTFFHTYKEPSFHICKVKVRPLQGMGTDRAVFEVGQAFKCVASVEMCMLSGSQGEHPSPDPHPCVPWAWAETIPWPSPSTAQAEACIAPASALRTPLSSMKDWTACGMPEKIILPHPALPCTALAHCTCELS